MGEGWQGGRVPETTRESALAVLRRLVGQPRRGVPRRPVRGDRDARRRPAAGPRRAAHRLGQVGGVLRRDPAAAPARRRPDLLVSPLLALMRDQVAAAARAGVRAVAINSANAARVGRRPRSSWPPTRSTCCWSRPSGSTTRAFREEQLPAAGPRAPGCWSSTRRTASRDWGHDFRPDYRRLRDLIAELPPGVPVLATTATANSRVVADVEEQLGHGGGAGVLTIRGPLARDLAAARRAAAARLPRARLGWLLSHLGDLPGQRHHLHAHGVRGRGHRPAAARGRPRGARLHRAHRPRRARASPSGAQGQPGQGARRDVRARHGLRQAGPRLRACTSGRRRRRSPTTSRSAAPAGRPASADVLLLPGPEDREIWQYFATASMPDEERAPRVLDRARREDGRCPPRRWRRASTSAARRWSCCSRCSTSTAPSRGSGRLGVHRPAVDLRRRAVRPDRRRPAWPSRSAMLEYERTDGCRMEFLSAASTTTTATPCGRCDNCAGAWYSGPAIAEDAAAPAGADARPGRRRRRTAARSGPAARTGSACRYAARSTPEERVEPRAGRWPG